MTLKAEAVKEKIDKLDFVKIKNFCVSKDTMKKVKRQLIEWAKILADLISDKDLVSRLYNKKTIQLKMDERFK